MGDWWKAHYSGKEQPNRSAAKGRRTEQPPRDNVCAAALVGPPRRSVRAAAPLAAAVSGRRPAGRSPPYRAPPRSLVGAAAPQRR